MWCSSVACYSSIKPINCSVYIPIDIQHIWRCTYFVYYTYFVHTTTASSSVIPGRGIHAPWWYRKFTYSFIPGALQYHQLNKCSTYNSKGVRWCDLIPMCWNRMHNKHKPENLTNCRQKREREKKKTCTRTAVKYIHTWYILSRITWGVVCISVVSICQGSSQPCLRDRFGYVQ